MTKFSFSSVHYSSVSLAFLENGVTLSLKTVFCALSYSDTSNKMVEGNRGKNADDLL
jgi:hypothetical protein